MTKTLRLSVLLFAACTLMPRAARAETDPRWQAWLGCWQSSTDGVATTDTRVCVVPTDTPAAVRLLVVTDDRVTSERRIVADSAAHAVDDDGCTGQRQSQWSKNGRLLFTQGEIACTGEPKQKLSGFSLFGKGPFGPEWVDIHVGSTSNRDTVQVQHYLRASVPPSLAANLSATVQDQAVAAAIRLASTKLTLADVLEANSKLQPRAVEAALIETNTVVPINSRALTALAKASAPDTLIDLMVALAYPRDFLIEKPSRSDTVLASGAAFHYPIWSAGSFTRDLWLDPAFYFYDRGYPYYSNSPDVVIFINSGSTGDSASNGGGGSGGAQNTGAGRVVNGQGYTRVVPASAAAASTTAATFIGSRSPAASSSGSSPSSSSSGSSGSSDSSRSGSSGSSGTSSSGGYVSSGESTGGRTAVARE